MTGPNKPLPATADSNIGNYKAAQETLRNLSFLSGRTQIRQRHLPAKIIGERLAAIKVSVQQYTDWGYGYGGNWPCGYGSYGMLKLRKAFSTKLRLLKRVGGDHAGNAWLAASKSASIFAGGISGRMASWLGEITRPVGKRVRSSRTRWRTASGVP